MISMPWWMYFLALMLNSTFARWFEARRHRPEKMMPYRVEWACPDCGVSTWLRTSDPMVTLRWRENVESDHRCEL